MDSLSEAETLWLSISGDTDRVVAVKAIAQAIEQTRLKEREHVADLCDKAAAGIILQFGVRGTYAAQLLAGFGKVLRDNS